MSSPYLDQLLTVLVSAAGTLIAKMGGANGGGLNFVAPLTATANGATGNVDIGFTGTSASATASPTPNTIALRDANGASAFVGLAFGTAVRGAGVQVALDIAAGGTIDLIDVYTGSTLTGKALTYSGGNLLVNLGGAFGLTLTGVSCSIALDTSGLGIVLAGTTTLSNGAIYSPQTAPSAPASNANVLYSITGTGHLAFKNSAGTVYDLTALAAATYVNSVGATSPLSNTGSASAPVVALTSSVPANLGGTGLSGPGNAGNLLYNPTGTAWASSAPNVVFFSLDCPLSGGTVTQASGKTLTNAVILSVRLKTPSVAVGAPTAVISGNNVVVTSYTAGAIQAATDGSTYTVVLAGAV